MRSNLVILFFLAFLFFCLPKSSFSCTYGSYYDPPLSYHIAKTKTIFLGKIIKKHTRFHFKDGEKYKIESIKLEVQKEFKGVDNKIQEVILTNRLTNLTSCDVEPPKMKVGEKWLIFKDYANAADWELFTKYSSKYQQEYLADIERIVKNPTTSIYIELQTPLGLSYIKDAEIILKGDGFSRVTQIVAKEIRSLIPGGHYVFENIPAGTYKIQVRLKYQAVDYDDKKKRAVYDEITGTYNFEYEISVKQDDTEYFLRVIEKQKEN